MKQLCKLADIADHVQISDGACFSGLHAVRRLEAVVCKGNTTVLHM